MRRLWYTLAAMGLLAGCAVLSGSVLSGCATGEIGSRCSGAPTDEGACVAGAVCAPDRATTTGHPNPPNLDGSHCRQICDDVSECTDPGLTCLVVGGSMLRACQPSGEPATGDAGT